MGQDLAGRLPCQQAIRRMGKKQHWESAQGRLGEKPTYAGCLMRGNAHMAPGANSLMFVRCAREAIQSVIATAEVDPRLQGVGSLVVVLYEILCSQERVV